MPCGVSIGRVAEANCDEIVFAVGGRRFVADHRRRARCSPEMTSTIGRSARAFHEWGLALAAAYAVKLDVDVVLYERDTTTVGCSRTDRVCVADPSGEVGC